jgi:hypothetical protein
LESGGDAVKHATIVLEKFGKNRLSLCLDACRSKHDDLKEHCKGGPNGTSWSEKLAADAGAPDILAAFDLHLKDLNVEERMEKRLAEMQKALRQHRNLCTCSLAHHCFGKLVALEDAFRFVGPSHASHKVYA